MKLPKGRECCSMRVGDWSYGIDQKRRKVRTPCGLESGDENDELEIGKGAWC